MATFKNIRIKKRGGGTRLQRVKVLKSGKFKFVKNLKSSKSKSKSSKIKTRKRSRKVAKKTNRKKSRSRIPLNLIVGNVMAVMGEPNPGWSSTYDNIVGGRYDQALQSYIAAWTGIRIGPIGGQRTTEIDLAGILNPFDMRNAPALKVALFTKLATKLIRKLGVNPISRIPFVKDYISFS